MSADNVLRLFYLAAVVCVGFAYLAMGEDSYAK